MLEMLNAFVSRFYQVFSPTTFSLMLIGIVVGDVIESMRKILAK